MSFTYNLGIPNPPNNPSADAPNMQTNTNTVGAWTAVDHVGFNVGTAGKHLAVTFPGVQTGPTAAFSNSVPYSQIFPKAFGSVSTQQLYYAETRSGGTTINRLVPTCQAYGRAQWNGSAWVLLSTPSDLLVNVASIASLSSQAFTVTFTSALGYTNYSVFLCGGTTGGAASLGSMVTDAIASSGFEVVTENAVASGFVVTFMVI